MISHAAHGLNLAYVVDVDVQTINGKPALYKIRTVHDSFPKDEDTEATV